MSKREFFMANGRYEFCEVLEDQDQETPFHLRRMKCRTDEGREFVAKPMYGTWGEVRGWDELCPHGMSSKSRCSTCNPY